MQTRRLQMIRPRPSPRPWLFVGALVVVVAAAAATTLYGFHEPRPARYAIIHRFTGGSDGSNPLSGLTVNGAGNLYGVTPAAIFKLSPPPPSSNAAAAEPSGASTEIPIWNKQILRLNRKTIGNQPAVPMILDQAGALYGITSFGGALAHDNAHDGTLFKLDASGPGLSDPVALSAMPVREFNDRYSDLIADASGALYGTTSGRGASSMGTVLKLSPTKDGWTMVTLHTFRGGDDGAYPEAGLVFDRAGALFGTTGGGGKDQIGTVFKLTPSDTGWSETIIHTFHQPDPSEGGVLPMAGLTIDRDGTLYGTTGGGGRLGQGTIFTLTPSGNEWTYQVLYNFSGQNGDGAAPNSRLVFGSSGELYGTTRYGGVAASYGGKGTVFRLAPIFRLAPSWFGWKHATIHAFAGGTDGDGSSLGGALVRSQSGALFGATTQGGSPRGEGTVYEITP
jgi:uncharacterized repeat protein (TIGR03803 family)